MKVKIKVVFGVKLMDCPERRYGKALWKFASVGPQSWKSVSGLPLPQGVAAQVGSGS